MEKRYPFKFLDAYGRDDIAFFFGREEEIGALYRMVFQARIIVVYGTSGTGKTSLIQCGLASKFQTYDWLALYIRRGNNLIASLDKALCAESDGMFGYAGQNEAVIRDLPQKIAAVYRASFKPLYLIFDQFEELYVLGNKQEQDQFVKTVQEILQMEQPVKVIISIREEYLGHLYDFERMVPELMRKKLRVEPMNLDKVQTVVRKVGERPESNVSLRAGHEKAIATAIFKKIRGKNALTIDLPYLQVFLDKLYLRITGDETRRADAVFTLAALKKTGDIGDVLRDFLDEQVVKIAREFEQPPDIIWEILSPFVTLDGTKEPLSESGLHDRRPAMSAVLLAAALQALVKSRILRFTEHDQRYEIAHDSLAKQVAAKRSDEEIALLEVQRLIKSQTALQTDAREFFSEKQLGFIEPYLGKFRPDADELDWIEQSRMYWRAQKEAQAMREREELEKAKAQAERERAMRTQAEAAKNDAIAQEQIAKAAKIDADNQRTNAIENERKARRTSKRAFMISVIAVIVAIAALYYYRLAYTKALEVEEKSKTIQRNQVIRQADELKIFGDTYWDMNKRQDALETYRTALDTLKNYRNVHPDLIQSSTYKRLDSIINAYK